MKSLIRTLVVLLFAISVSATVFAGGRQQSTAPGQNGTQVVENMLVVDEAPSDQFFYTNNGIRFNSTMLFSAVLKSTPDLNDVLPDLATSYTVSPDMLTFTFTIRKDAVWHDGTPLTPEDIKFNLMLPLKLGIVKNTYQKAFGAIVGAQDYIAGRTNDVSGITINGDVVTVKMTQIYGSFLQVLAQWVILPKHLLEKEDPLTLHTNPFWQKPVGTGPYKVGEVAWGNYAILERNEAYYGAKPQIERIKMIRPSDLAMACQAGELDYFTTNNMEVINAVSKLSNYEVFPIDIYFMRYFIMKINSPEGPNKAMNDVRIRQALLYGIDRDTIVEQLFPNGEVTDTFVPVSFPEYWDDAVHYTYNPDLAKRLLQEAGWDFNYTIKLRYYYNDQATRDLCDLLAYYWSQIGVKIDHAFLQGDATSLIYQTRDHDIVYKGLSAFGYEDGYGEMISDGNIMRYLVNDNVFDDLNDQLNRTVDPAKRAEVIKELQKLDQQYLYRLPFFSLKQYIVVNTAKVKTAGIYGNDWYNYDRQIEKWEIIGR